MEPVSSGEENRLLDFLFFVRDGKIASQFPRDKFLVPDCAYFCQPEGTHVNTCQGTLVIMRFFLLWYRTLWSNRANFEILMVINVINIRKWSA